MRLFRRNIRYILKPVSDAIVVGAGVVGAAIAYRLAEAGLRITVVDGREPGSGTSASSLAWLNSFAKEPDHYHGLNVRGIDEHRALAAESGGQSFLHLSGGLAWERAGTDQDLLRKVARCRRLGYEVVELTPLEANELEPDLAVSDASTVFRAPQEGWLDAPGLARHLVAESARRFGATVIRDRVNGFQRDGAAVAGVRLAGYGPIAGALVVNSAGPEATVLAQLAGASLPVGGVLGAVLVTGAVQARLRHVLHPPQVALRPEPGGRLAIRYDGLDETLAGTTAFASGDDRCAEALRRAGEWLPAAAGARVEEVRLGVRPLPGDGLPIVGPDPLVPGLYHAVTHSGVTLAAVLGRLVCSEVLGIPAPELDPYRPARFGQAAVTA